MGVKVIASDPEVIDICFDKYKTAQWVVYIVLNAPKTHFTLASAKEVLAKFPLFIKPRWGSGSIGLKTIDNMEELNYTIIS